MAVSSVAPATHSQPSRKGKRAWRKNVDVEHVTSGLDAIREEYRQTGHTISDAPEEQLFYTDLTGDTKVRKRLEKEQPRLKADRILAERSKVPAVESRKTASSSTSDGVLKRKREGYVSHKERERLWKFANSGGKHATHSVNGADEIAAYDPWATPEKAPTNPNQSFLEAKRPIREPETLRYAPLALTASGKTVPDVPKPHAGRSYNPRFQDWSNLLEREGNKEVEAEKKRQRLAAEEKDREARAAIAAAEADREEEERAVMSEHESEWEGFQSEPDELQLKAKRPERKTAAERNKIKRRKAAEALERHESKMKQREKQERQLDAIRRAVEKEHQRNPWTQTFEGFSSDEDRDDAEGEEDVILAKRPRFGRKFVPPSQDLELVLPDELKDSLRLLKPEGNLLKDRYRTMILQGKTEGRTPLPMQKKPRREQTEKWSYKDWRLENA